MTRGEGRQGCRGCKGETDGDCAARAECAYSPA